MELSAAKVLNPFPPASSPAAQYSGAIQKHACTTCGTNGGQDLGNGSSQLPSPPAEAESTLNSALTADLPSHRATTLANARSWNDIATVAAFTAVPPTQEMPAGAL